MFNFRNSSSSGYVGFQGVEQNQFGYSVITIQCPVRDILDFLQTDTEVQRELDVHKVTELSHYIQYGLDGNNIYFPPLIFSSRDCGIFEKSTNEFRLKFGEKLTILDGQHRIQAFTHMKNRLGNKLGDEFTKELYERVMNFPLTIQVYRNLNLKEEKQLFTDINTKSSPVSKTLMLNYGDGELYGELIREVVISHPSISSDMFEDRARSTQKKLMTLKTLCYIASMVNDGKMDSRDGKFTINSSNFSLYKNRVEEFLTLLNKYTPHEKMDRNKYVVLNPGVLLGIAKFVHDIEKRENVSMEFLFRNIVHKVDWTHKNKDFLRAGNKFNPKTKKINFNTNRKTIRIMSDYLFEQYVVMKKGGYQLQWV